MTLLGPRSSSVFVNALQIRCYGGSSFSGNNKILFGSRSPLALLFGVGEFLITFPGSTGLIVPEES